MTVVSRDVDVPARDLIRLLNGLTSLHGELAMHMRNKLEAIKQADSDRIQSITAREMVLANRISEREGLRRQITRNIVANLPLESSADKTPRLSELAEHFAEPVRSKLLATAGALRAQLEEINRMRVKNELITQEMLKHLGEVLSVMRSGGKGTDVYSRAGNRERTSPANVFEAVG